MGQVNAETSIQRCIRKYYFHLITILARRQLVPTLGCESVVTSDQTGLFEGRNSYSGQFVW